MALVIDLVRALREPEYRDEISEELESDITDHVRLEAADEIECLRAEKAELVRVLEGVEWAGGRFKCPECRAPYAARQHENHCRVGGVLSRARAKEDT